MNLVETHIINSNNPLYNEIDKLCFLSKNLYNAGNYIVRQEFFTTSKLKESGLTENATWIRYNELTKLMINNPDYVALPRKVSQQTLMILDRNWKSFFRSIKDYALNKDKYNGQPKPPTYKHKQSGRFILTYTEQSISKKDLKKGLIKLSGTNITIPYINKEYDVQQVRVIPMSNKLYKIEIVYEKPIKELNLEKSNILGVDLGLENIMTITTNLEGFTPIMVKGGTLKSINQYYNKRLSKYKSELPKEVKTSKKINKLTAKRNLKIKHYLHKYSKYVINLCKQNNIGTIVIGVNKEWKQGINIGDVNNQNFVSIPFAQLRQMIKYKAELLGITYIEQEESYTSKASFLDSDHIPVYNTKICKEHVFSGKRIKRGLYKSKENVIIHADVNGSYNIIRKAFPNAFAKGIEGVVVHPNEVAFVA